MQKFSHLPLSCFQNLSNVISSAAPVASSSSCFLLTCTFIVVRKAEREEKKENERETLMKWTTKWTASSSGRWGNSTNVETPASLIALLCRMTVLKEERRGAECKSALNPLWIVLIIFSFTSLMIISGCVRKVCLYINACAECTDL